MRLLVSEGLSLRTLSAVKNFLAFLQICVFSERAPLFNHVLNVKILNSSQNDTKMVVIFLDNGEDDSVKICFRSQ